MLYREGVIPCYIALLIYVMYQCIHHVYVIQKQFQAVGTFSIV